MLIHAASSSGDGIKWDNRKGEREMTTARISPVAVSQFDELNGKYEIAPTERARIQAFLEEHPFLYPIVKEAKEHIASVFGHEARVCLELEHDPEEGWDELFVVVRSRCSAEEAIRLENKLMDEWFLDRMNDTKGKLSIVEEPQ